ncbi:MAG: sulfatase [Deltaproteobacteria bacterium]|nr:sulfatase [Deltaproteobacteria bacterium]
MIARKFMLVLAVAATLAGVGALVYLGVRPGPERLSPDTDLAELFADYGCPDCNVLLISIDTLRADHLPCQGYPKDTAPNICAFGEQGLLFRNAVSGAPSTVPALIAMLSGSIAANEDPRELIAHYEQQPSLAERLAERGYQTAGFTDHHALRAQTGAMSKTDFLLRGFETFVNVGKGRQHRHSADLTKPIIDWLEQNREQKFFVWAHYFDPHWNYMPPDDLERRFGYVADRCGGITNGIDIKEVREIEKALTNDELDCLIALHQAEIFHTDRFIGQLLDKIAELDLDDDTLVVITADHGEEFLERDRVGHEWTVYEELMHVPLIVRNPKRPVAGALDANISTASIFEIVLGAVSDRPIELPTDVVGRAFHYYGKNAKSISEFRRRPNEFAIYIDRMKLILTPKTSRYELYDLDADPKERQNLGVKRAKASPLYGRLRRWIEASTVSPGSPSEAGLNSRRELRQRLQNLGYSRED